MKKYLSLLLIPLSVYAQHNARIVMEKVLEKTSKKAHTLISQLHEQAVQPVFSRQEINNTLHTYISTHADAFDQHMFHFIGQYMIKATILDMTLMHLFIDEMFWKKMGDVCGAGIEPMLAVVTQSIAHREDLAILLERAGFEQTITEDAYALIVKVFARGEQNYASSEFEALPEIMELKRLGIIQDVFEI